MKKIGLSLFGMLAIYAASAQLSFGVNANYTQYKGDFQQSTPGAQIRGSYSFSPKTAAVLSFTYGMPIKEESTVQMADASNNTIDVASQITYKFKTINFVGQYNLIGDEESTGKLYGMVGGGLVLVTYNEAITGNYDKSQYTEPMNQLEKTTENGLTLNFGVGGAYRVGTPVIFGEAALALPANQANGQYIENVIPAHFIFNLGVKLNIGGSNQ